MPIPVLLIAGFLGSGKTTLLNGLLRNRLGVRIGLIVNDFGTINVDAMLVSAQVDSVVSFSGGCICCVADTSDLDTMLLTLSGADLDMIVIEASGLAEPQTLISMVLASAANVTYGGLTQLVDAASFDDVRQRYPEVAHHIRLADLVVLNKADLVPESTITELRRRLRDLNARAPIVATSYASVDPAVLLTDPAPREEPEQLSLTDLLITDDHGDHMHHRFATVELPDLAPVHPRRFVEFLDSQPTGVYRMKGVVTVVPTKARESRYVVHTVGDHIAIERAAADAPPGLVVIGDGFDAEATRARLIATLARQDEVVKQDLIVFERYLSR